MLHPNLALEAALESALPSPATPLHEAMRYAVLGGGKRLRGWLCLESAKLFDIPENLFMPTAIAIEMLHAYSLVHDDLPAMDNSPLRRGKPSCHVAFSEATAILAGDALLTDCFAHMAGLALPPANVLALIKALSLAAGSSGMVLGQALDMQAEKEAITLEQLKILHAAKTGALIQFACISGALAVRADSSPLRQFGALLGALFQLTDDLLDVRGNPALMGKNTHQDGGKTTYLTFYSIIEATALAEKLAVEAEACLKNLPRQGGALQGLAQWVLRREQ